MPGSAIAILVHRSNNTTTSPRSRNRRPPARSLHGSPGSALQVGHPRSGQPRAACSTGLERQMRYSEGRYAQLWNELLHDHATGGAEAAV
jgi:hypothetical protein